MPRSLRRTVRHSALWALAVFASAIAGGIVWASHEPRWRDVTLG